MKNNLYKTVLTLSVLSISLLVFRVFYTQSGFYLFLLSNLFLAIIPYKITNHLQEFKNNFLLYLLFPIWLLFFAKRIVYNNRFSPFISRNKNANLV